MEPGRSAMQRRPRGWLLGFAALLLVGGCATRPVNPPIAQADPASGYRYSTRAPYRADHENLLILAFSGGGTRAAAFSYGVLEALRDIEIVGPRGNRERLLDAVDIVTGVSGGSFTALAYALYGDKLFADYPERFLKRDVEGELLRRLLSPGNWPSLNSTGWGRSELAAQYYDEILFDGATFGDLDRGKGPLAVVTATDISTGARLAFVQPPFDILCSDVGKVKLSRAAAASSAVPVVLSPVTMNNYGGTCGFALPKSLELLTDRENPPRPAARAMQHLVALQSYQDSVRRPYIHLVDGGISDNLGMRGVLEVLEEIEALHALGQPTPLDHVRRIVVVVVNSLSTPSTGWDRSEAAPGPLDVLLKATGVPIDHHSFEAVELLKDMQHRWATMRRVAASPAYTPGKDPGTDRAIRVPRADIHVIDVSFPRLADQAEVEFLNSLPTSFALPADAVDRLRAAAGEILRTSPDFQRLLKEAGARVASDGARPPGAGAAR